MSDIVCLWATRWDGLWQRHQQLMSRLAARHRILYVESPRDAWSLLRGRARAAAGRGRASRPRAVPDTLHRVSPVVPFSLRRYPRLAAAHHRLLLSRLRAVLKTLAMHEPILWICYPQAEYFAGRLNEAFACYDCCDELTDVSARIAPLVREQERRILDKVRFVFATSEPLRDRLSRLHPDVHVLPNGADVEHFARGGPPPADLAAIPRPHVGFAGSIQHWVDTDLIAAAARRRPEWSWVLVGGVHADVAALDNLPNVHLLGEKPYEELPGYVRSFDACLVPFRAKPITHAADPIKVYEYLAAGKPVVSTPIPRVEALGDCVRIARDEAALVAEIGAAMAQDTDAARQARIAVARQHSWDARIALLDRLWDAGDRR
jgi:glycosyltransferase involved in cell wall biosynthesis